MIDAGEHVVEPAAPPAFAWGVFTPHIFHGGKIGTAGVFVGIVAVVDGAIVAALIAGVFTLVNTGLTVWLTGRQRDRDDQLRDPRRRKRRREAQTAGDEGE